MRSAVQQPRIDPAAASAWSLLRAAAPEPGPDRVVDSFGGMVARGELDLDRPGHGRTRERWAALAVLGRRDLALARLAEGHADALAILAEGGATPVDGARYGVWAARSGGTGATLEGPHRGARRLHGTVRFCSGAHQLDRALIVAQAPGGARIVDVGLDDPRIRPVSGTWRAQGMAASDSADVELDDVAVSDGQLLGPPGFYTGRNGFWWGGAGVAAVWLGGAAGVCDDVRAVLGGREPDPHQLAGLGALQAELAAADALLARTAAQIDADPTSPHRDEVWAARAAAERLCRTVLDLAPRTAGAAALTRGERFAARLADLLVYSRQHHGERDLAELGRAVLDGGAR